VNEKLLYFSNTLASLYINVMGSKKSFKRILVVKLDEIGDMVTALHVFYNLHNTYPDVPIDVYCKPVNRIFFKYLNYVHCVEMLSNEAQYDLIVELRGNQETLAYSLKHKPRYRLDRGTVRLKNKLKGGQKNEIHTNAEIIEPLVNTVDLNNEIITGEFEKEKINDLLEPENMVLFVLVHAGARDAARRWPTKRFAAVVDHINQTYGWPCILVGGEDDASINAEILSNVKQKINLNVAGTLNLIEYAELAKRASLFVGNESGPLHIAASAKIPLVALFGPGVRNVFYPLGKNVKVLHYFLAKGHKKQTLENSTIFHIQVQEVIDAVDQFIKKGLRTQS
jgi:ADP-heptose:LPS heptosyltransferase